MKLYEVVLFMLIFNVALSIINSSAVMGTGVNPSCQPMQSWLDSMTATALQQNITTMTATPANTLTSWFWGAVQGITVFTDVIGNATWNLHGMLSSCMYLDENTAALISIIIWFIYIIGLVQLWRGNSTKQME